MWSSTDESAPNEETTASSPSSNCVAACRSTPTPSISSNMPLSAMMPRARSLSGLASATANLGIAIERLLERRLADPAIGIDERFAVARALRDIEVDQLLDRSRHFIRNQPVPENI